MQTHATGNAGRLLAQADVPALRSAHSRAKRSWWWAVAAAVAMIALAFLSYVHERGALEHVLGRSEQVTARVQSVHVEERCTRSLQYRHRIEVTWTSDGTSGSGSYRQCRDVPAVGDDVQVWVTAAGYVETESPAAVRLGIAALSLAFAAMAVGLVAAVLLPRQRARRRLLQATGSAALPPVLVHVRSAPGGRIAIGPAAASEVGAPAMPATVLFTAQAPSAPTTRRSRNLGGTWQLRLEPEVRSRRQLGVLDRPGWRCWVECRGRPDRW